ncbi:MAG: hypothetical protein KZQ80_10670 [Candidatus Thiodiazotropha sp. (ex Monitilora ramsayi)]|nr:hypothetical protein [Candidatus Thiodiazotropha sp. (ex Monitilora ramsayi)]
MSRILIILSALLLAGCSKPLDIQLEPEVHVFLSNGSEQRIRLTPEDKAYAVLNEWLRTHRSGWYSTSGRYPGGVYIKSGDSGIQITDTHVVLYSTTPPKPKAIYIQKIGKGDLREIRNIDK